MTAANRARAVLTIQLEDELRVDREHSGRAGVGDPAVVEQHLERAIETLAGLDVRATFFAPGRLAAELGRAVWRPLVALHELGAQGLARAPVPRLGPDRFADDARRGREALQDAAGVEITTFRAPDFAVDGCEPWFGAGLVSAGFAIDASLRLSSLPEDAHGGCHPLAGSDGAVTELPLPMLPANLPMAGQRIMYLGSAAFRMLPLPSLRVVFELAESQGFVPQVVLQLADFDPGGPSGFEGDTGWRARFEQLLRNTGKDGVASKLQQLGWRWRFGTVAEAVAAAADAS